MTGGLARLNALPAEVAEEAFLSCCGSKAWAKQMAERRPFEAIEGLRVIADAIWWSLGSEAWLEAFRSHPRIGEKRAEKPTTAEATRWSAEEQGNSDDTSVSVTMPETLAALAEANTAYEERFGYTFIVCAQGRSKEEILALLRRRIQNDPDTEILAAAREQSRITDLRLEKLVQMVGT